MPNMKELGQLDPASNNQQLKHHKLVELCSWIDNHLDEQSGWQELMAVSGLDYRAIQTLFYLHEGTTAMTWIRQRRKSPSDPNDTRPLPLSIPKKAT